MERMGGSKQSLGSIASISKKNKGDGAFKGKEKQETRGRGRKRKQVIFERAGSGRMKLTVR
jgi:hypothetical protein